MTRTINYQCHSQARGPRSQAIIQFIGHCSIVLRWLVIASIGFCFLCGIALVALFYTYQAIQNYRNIASYSGVRLSDSTSSIPPVLGKPTLACKHEDITYSVYLKRNIENSNVRLVVFESKEEKITAINITANDEIINEQMNIEFGQDIKEIEATWGNGKLSLATPDETYLSYNKDVGIFFLGQKQNITFRFFHDQLFAVRLTPGGTSSIGTTGQGQMHPCNR